MSTAVASEVARRRVIAIISHPDAGKTTLTERLLTSSGAKQRFGMVKARRGESASSDWMQMERDRGISISSAVVRFEHDGVLVNLVDTPGHEDFSEDTYRALAAVDAAIMVVDAAKGVEERTRRLFAVCRTRRVPIIVLVNKVDRPSLEPLEILDDLHRSLDVAPVPVSWPIDADGKFGGIVAAGGKLTVDHGAELRHREAAAGELELAISVFGPLTREAFLAADACPVHFGSALTGDGIAALLDDIAHRVPAPVARETADGGSRPLASAFSGFVFKVQSNQDPRHRDRMAFVRVCSGRFERGMRVQNPRSGRTVSLAYAHTVQARDRTTTDEAWPGDVVGIVSAGELLVGDTLHDGEPVRFPPIPTFAPDQLRRCVNTDVSKRKGFRRGLDALADEGVVQTFEPADEAGTPEPVVGGAGTLQFEVLETRMREEYSVTVRLEPLSWAMTRATDEHWFEQARGMRGVWRLRRRDGTPFLALDGTWRADYLRRDHPDIVLEAVVG